MSISSSDSVWTLGATRIQVPIGATLALFCQPQVAQISWLLKWISGGTCEILSTGIGSSNLNLNFGTTVPPATLASQSGQGFLLGPIGSGSDWESIAIPGPAAFYLSATGATAIVSAMLFKGQGY